jgi:hypothetical protein
MDSPEHNVYFNKTKKEQNGYLKVMTAVYSGAQKYDPQFPYSPGYPVFLLLGTTLIFSKGGWGS